MEEQKKILKKCKMLKEFTGDIGQNDGYLMKRINEIFEEEVFDVTPLEMF